MRRELLLFLVLLAAGMLLLGCPGAGQPEEGAPSTQAPLPQPQEETPQADLCADVECPSAPCRSSNCNPETGGCEHENLPDGTACGQFMECAGGECADIFSLVEEAPESASIAGVARYVAPGMCYLGSGAVLANYQNRSINDKLAYAYAGSTMFEDTQMMSGYGPAPMIAAMINEPSNLGFEVYTGGRQDINLLYELFVNELPEENVIKFDTTEGAFEYLKRLVASGHPVMVCAMTTPLFGRQFEGPDFFVVTGYDAENIYTNLVFDPGGRSGINYAIPIDAFKGAWTETAIRAGAMGPNVMIWYEYSGKARSEEEILGMLKEDAERAPQRIRNYAEMLRTGTAQAQPHMYEAGQHMRGATALFLRKHGLDAAAEKYEEAAELYSSFDAHTPQSQVAGILDEIAAIEQQAVDSWQ